MKWFGAFAVVAALISSPALAVDLDKLYDQAVSPTVQLNRDCSGTIVYSGRDEESGDVTTVILTAKHCVSDTKDLTFDVIVPVYDETNSLIEEKVYKALSPGMYYKDDLAIVRLKDKDTLFKNVAKLGPVEEPNIKIGSPVYTIGYPAGRSIAIADGMFSGKEAINFPDAKKDVEYYRSSANIMGGNSGGGLFLELPSGEFQLIGVASARLNSAEFIGYYVTLNSIHSYLKIAVPELYTPKK